MMSTTVQKKPLDLNLYQKYEIPQDYMAYELVFNDISQLECDDLEHEYHIKGYKIFHSEIARSTGDLFKYKLIVAKSEIMTF